MNAYSFRLNVVALALVATAAHAVAQAPVSGPLILRLPVGTRATSLGGAWVAGRDEDVIFYNPAQIAARTGFNLSLARYGSTITQGSMASGFSGGPWSMALGWGIQAASSRGEYLFFPPGGTQSTDVLSLEAVVGASFLVKGFRVGAAGKFVTDRLSQAFDPSTSLRQTFDKYLGDAGISRGVLSGNAAIAVQNIGGAEKGSGTDNDPPLQASIGWASRTYSPEPFDVNFYGQVTGREGWIAPGGGVEIGYGWIEGYSAGIRLGARRPETDAEKPFALGATFTGDHLTLDYAVQFFDGGRHANRMTIRWR